ncbi:MAG: hemerythrin domain-containing protein [Ignavibacteria bacterium]|nr:hemerythrin domain-containing protein [Ignavibacteria bacterium]
MKNDPIKRFVEKESSDELSPMDPPDAYSPPALEKFEYEEFHPFIQKFLDEHKASLKQMDEFEQTLKSIQDGSNDSKPEISKSLSQFFSFIDSKLVLHNVKEEKILFPLLQKRLLENGEHSKGVFPKTGVDNLESEHVKLMQITSVCFNFFGLASRLPDADSRTIVLDLAIEQGKALIEYLRLHIFREDNVIFPLAQKFITEEEFDEMDSKVPLYEHF